MKKALLALSVILALAACNDSSSDTKETIQETVQEIVPSFETTKVKLQFNFPSSNDATNLDAQNFTPDDPFTYTASTSVFVCEPDGSKKTLAIYLLIIESNKWDVYFHFNDEQLHIEGGETGASGQNKATIEFDEAGNFIRQIPYILKTIEIQYPEKNYNIEFDFYSDLTTSFNEPFNVKNLDVNGC
jgi:flagellar hook protein FlgE